MWMELIDRSHPFLIRRIIRVVGDFRDLTQTTACRLEAFAPLFVGFLTELPIWIQA
jgi:hypothetical protein